jgi:glycosyltransferase involved in cell wall biosynthesis
MTICFYSPYLPHSFGGGEKHLFEMALVLAKKHTVSVAVSDKFFTTAKKISMEYEQFIGKDLSTLQFTATPIGSSATFLKKLWWTKQFDQLFYWTDGSLFFSLAKNNHLHLQIPFTDKKNSIIDRVKLLNWSNRNANSFFTKEVIEKNWRVAVQAVVHPAVMVSELKTSQEKMKIILHVGRFFKQLHTKRQDVLVRLFKDMLKKYPTQMSGWELVLIGAPEDMEYVQEVRKLAADAPITFHHNLSRAELITWYQRAALYWHATGYDVNTAEHPECAEHFGITTIEAMAAGAVPVVFAAGGQPEILGTELKHLGWSNLQEAESISISLLSDPQKLSQARILAEKKANSFNYSAFANEVEQLVAT